MRKIGVLILGTYRSGTSVTAGVMHHLGFDTNSKPAEEENSKFNPTGSFSDKYFHIPVKIDFQEYFLIKNKFDLWSCKSHLFFQNNLIEDYKKNFPEDRESWLIVTDRQTQNSIDSFTSVSGGRDLSSEINKQKKICQETYDSWDNDKKIIVNFNELKNNTFETIKNICSTLNINFVEAAQNHVQANLSNFGE